MTFGRGKEARPWDIENKGASSDAQAKRRMSTQEAAAALKRALAAEAALAQLQQRFDECQALILRLREEKAAQALVLEQGQQVEETSSAAERVEQAEAGRRAAETQLACIDAAHTTLLNQRAEELQGLKSALSDALSETAQLKAQLENADANSVLSEKAMALCEQEKRELEGERDSAVAALLVPTARMTGLEEQITELEEELDQEQRQKSAATSLVGSLEEELSRCKAGLEEAMKGCSAAENQKDELKELRSLRKMLGQVEEGKARGEQTITELRAELDALKVGGACSEDRMKQLLLERSTECDTAQRRVAELVSESTARERMSEELNQTNQSTLKDAEERTARVQAELNTVTGSLMSKNAEANSVGRQMKTLQDKLGAVQAELDSVRLQHSELSQSKSDEANKLHAELAAAQNANTEQTKQLSQATQKCSSMQGELTELNSSKSKLACLLETATLQLEVIQTSSEKSELENSYKLDATSEVIKRLQEELLQLEESKAMALQREEEAVNVRGELEIDLIGAIKRNDELGEHVEKLKKKLSECKKTLGNERDQNKLATRRTEIEKQFLVSEVKHGIEVIAAKEKNVRELKHESKRDTRSVPEPPSKAPEGTKYNLAKNRRASAPNEKELTLPEQSSLCKPDHDDAASFTSEESYERPKSQRSEKRAVSRGPSRGGGFVEPKNSTTKSARAMSTPRAKKRSSSTIDAKKFSSKVGSAYGPTKSTKN